MDKETNLWRPQSVYYYPSPVLLSGVSCSFTVCIFWTRSLKRVEAPLSWRLRLPDTNETGPSCSRLRASWRDCVINFTRFVTFFIKQRINTEHTRQYTYTKPFSHTQRRKNEKWKIKIMAWISFCFFVLDFAVFPFYLLGVYLCVLLYLISVSISFLINAA